jgi:hypothetical protein
MNYDPNIFTRTNVTNKGNGARMIHGFHRVRLENGEEKHIPMSIFYDPRGYINSMNRKKFGNIEVLRVN